MRKHEVYVGVPIRHLGDEQVGVIRGQDFHWIGPYGEHYSQPAIWVRQLRKISLRDDLTFNTSEAKLG